MIPIIAALVPSVSALAFALAAYLRARAHANDPNAHATGNKLP